MPPIPIFGFSMASAKMSGGQSHSVTATTATIVREVSPRHSATTNRHFPPLTFTFSLSPKGSVYAPRYSALCTLRRKSLPQIAAAAHPLQQRQFSPVYLPRGAALPGLLAARIAALGCAPRASRRPFRQQKSRSIFPDFHFLL